MTTRPWARPSVLAAAWLAASAFAGEAPAPLEQGFHAAWARQPEQRAAPLRRDASAAQAEAAARWTAGPPALDLSTTTDRLTHNGGGREYEAAIAVPLWLPGERAGSRAVAQAGSAALEARLGAARWRVAGEVREAWWALHLARQDGELARQRAASAQQLAADVARRLQAGDLARLDQHQADGAAAAARGAVAASEAAWAEAQQRWTALTGLPPPQALAAARSEPLPVVDAGDAIDARHPALAEANAGADAARKARALVDVQARGNPELSLGATRERGSFDERYAQTLTLGLRIPLGDSSGHRAKAATAAAEQLEAELQFSLARERVQSQARIAASALAAAGEVLAAAERRAVLAVESRGFVDKSFRLGETDLPSRLRAELEAVQAEREAARSRIARFAAVSQLRQALGLLPE